MNRTRFFALLAGGAAATIAAVPAFANDETKPAKQEKLAKVERLQIRQDAEERVKELAQRVRGSIGQGTVKSLDANARTFVVTTPRGDVTVSTDASTTYHQGREQSLSFASLQVGQRVVVQTDRPDKPARPARSAGTPTPGATPTVAPTATPSSSTLLARRIIILPEPKPRQQRTVTVGAVSNVSIAANGTGSFTVTPTGAAAVNFVADANTVYALKGVSAFANGQTARVVSVKNDAGANLAQQVRVPAGA